MAALYLDGADAFAGHWLHLWLHRVIASMLKE